MVGGGLIFIRSIVTIPGVIFRTTHNGKKQFSPRSIGHYLCLPFQITNEQSKALWNPPSSTFIDKFKFWQMNWVLCVASGAVVGLIGETVLKKVC